MDTIGIRKVIIGVAALAAIACITVFGVSPLSTDGAKDAIIWIVSLFTGGNIAEHVISRVKNGKPTEPTQPTA